MGTEGISNRRPIEGPSKQPTSENLQETTEKTTTVAALTSLSKQTPSESPSIAAKAWTHLKGSPLRTALIVALVAATIFLSISNPVFASITLICLVISLLGVFSDYRAQELEAKKTEKEEGKILASPRSTVSSAPSTPASSESRLDFDAAFNQLKEEFNKIRAAQKSTHSTYPITLKYEEPFKRLLDNQDYQIVIQQISKKMTDLEKKRRELEEYEKSIEEKFSGYEITDKSVIEEIEKKTTDLENESKKFKTYWDNLKTRFPEDGITDHFFNLLVNRVAAETKKSS